MLSSKKSVNQPLSASIGMLMSTCATLILLAAAIPSRSAYAGWEFHYNSKDRCFPTPQDACNIYNQDTLNFGWCADLVTSGDGPVQYRGVPTGGFLQPWPLRCVIHEKRWDVCGALIVDHQLEPPDPIFEYECGPHAIDRYHRKPQDCRAPSYGNPIYPLDSAKMLNEVLVTRAIGWEKLEIMYDSTPKLHTAAGSTSFNAKPPESFGELWSTNLHKVLRFQKQSTGTLRGIQAFRGNGVWISFRLEGNNWISDPEIIDTLEKVGNNWRYIDHANSVEELFNNDGQIISSTSARGGRIEYDYSSSSTPLSIAPSPGLMIGISDNSNRSIQFRYARFSNQGVRISEMTDAGGRLFKFNYDSTGNLVEIIWPDLKSRKFLYEAAELPWALTGIIDENNSRTATYGYDSSGRAIETVRAGGIDHYSVSYTSPPYWEIIETTSDDNKIRWRDHYFRGGGEITVTGPDRMENKMIAVDFLDSPRMISQTQPAGSGCLESTRRVSYSMKGRVQEEVDFNGVAACYSYDMARNLETGRIEGLKLREVVPSCNVETMEFLEEGARKISTKWHPYWHLPSKRAEPGKITTWVFHGEPDPFANGAPASCLPADAVLPSGRPLAVICRQIEQLTLDNNGSYGFNAVLQNNSPPKNRSWTYNSNGQVLTSSDPLGYVTQYSYYNNTGIDNAKGDLQSIVNALGQVVKFQKYSKNGQLLNSSDANGVVTINAYDDRDRLLSNSIAGRIIRFEYDGVGLLKKVINADGSWISYSYDEAHRRNSIHDNIGNRIDFTLDNRGYVTKKIVRDNSGILQRQIDHVIDALGRVQQTAGGNK